ncbi:phage baseplate protein [Dyadobacter psychrotolerans]|uniref:Dit-like phage tail protein N-terminal domain-containing protein n=1 Tax=Dyadobacter psychrotolerans TaxID=2541721 RepID=A0A4R5DTH6_9BACT|nr:hypothetical protein [Dyadobacter psychrotolerans]TDE17719.1 hypothetical protein E0F88_07460 [Dyadobacter psychrotolerans]
MNISGFVDSFSKYIVRPINAFGLGGFVFDIANDTTVLLTNEITDHYTEDNSTIQDHIAVKPKRVTLSTFVGELVHRTDGNTDTVLQNVTQKLTILSDYLPKLSAGATQLKSVFEGKNKLDTLTGIGVNNIVDLWATVKNLTPPTQRQQQAYMYFKALAEQKIIVSLQTPFEYMANMAIESVTAVQSGDSEWISEFTITLKEIRYAKTKTVAFDRSKYRSKSGALNGTTPVGATSGAVGPQNRNGVQNAPVTNKGNVTGKVMTNNDIKALSNDPIFLEVYPKSPALPPSLPLSNLQ